MTREHTQHVNRGRIRRWIGDGVIVAGMFALLWLGFVVTA